MTRIKDFCLGVAAAGLVAGAGSTIAVAVAAADSSEPAASETAGPAADIARPAPRGPARAAAESRRGEPPTRIANRAGAPRAGISAGADRDVAPGTLRSAPERAAATVLESVPATPPTPGPPPAPAAPAVAAAVTSSATSTRGRTAAAVAAPVADPPPTHVLLIGADGVNMSKILEYAYDDPASGFRTIMDEGVTGTTSLIGHTTISGPSWSTILTGAWDNKTGVVNNIFDPAPYNSWPTVFNLIEYHRPDVDTAIVANWDYMNDIAAAGGYPADVNQFIAFDTSWEDTDDLVAQATIDLINATSASASSFIFSYQVAVDEAGHSAGGDSPEYRAALINTSENIAAIMAAVNAWEAANPGQEWTVITTTDHGHQPQQGFGHGFQSPNETASFVIFDLEGDGANDGTQNLGYSNTDITPTIISLYGIAQRSDFDGVPLQTKAAGIITPTDLKESVGDALGLYGYPDTATDIALSVRTIVGAVPYFLNGFVDSVTGFLGGVADQDIFLISALAGVAEFVVQFVGDALVSALQAVAVLVGRLTGSGTIPPSDDPLPPPAAESQVPTAVLT